METSHVYLIYTDESPLHMIDDVGLLQGAHVNIDGAKKCAHDVHSEMKKADMTPLTIVIQSPTGMWTEGLMNLTHFDPAYPSPHDQSRRRFHGNGNGKGNGRAAA
jgi:hypothetical protein